MMVRKSSPTFTSIEDEPGVRLRNSRQYEYTKSKFTIGKSDGISFLKNENGAEMTGFVLSNGKIYTFSVSGVDVDEVMKLFDSITSSASLEQIPL